MSDLLESSTVRAYAVDHASEDGNGSDLRLRVVHSVDEACVNHELALANHGSFLIGRRKGLSLSLADERVSRAHMRIVWDARVHAYRYADLGSANGTYVNGDRCASGIIGRNDTIRVGDTLLVCGAPVVNDRLESDTNAAASSTLPVLVLGESGSGKELVARQVHERSGRRGAFVAVNCATLPKDLVAAELFGHVRGAFSGANCARDGLLRASAGGTLFLDEIGDLALEVQPTLLRCLQERSVRPVGSDLEVPVDLRVVAATNVDLEQRAVDGFFREDLLARLAYLVLRVPPLRQRKTDLLHLVRAFTPELKLTVSAAEALLRWHWPRNVRELRAVVESLATLNPTGRPISLAAVVERIPELARELGERSLQSTPPPDDRRGHLSALLEKHAGNVAAVARELGKPRSHVYRWMRNLALSRADFEH